MQRQSKTWVSQRKRFIGEEMSMKDAEEWAGSLQIGMKL